MSGNVIAAILAGVVLTSVAFAHAIGPALMLAAVTPFDAIPFALFGVAGNAITYVPVIIFLIKLNPRQWGQALLGTRVQQYAALLLLALLVSHAFSVPDLGSGMIFEWLRKLTLFVLMGILCWSMRDARHLAMLVKVSVSAMAVFVVLSALDFYLGVQLLPLKAGRLEGAALETQYQSWLATSWRFTGPGYPVNRFSNYLLLVIFLGLGWFMSVRSTSQRSLALGCTVVLVVAELLTVTRSGILGMGVGLVLLLPLAFRFRASQVVGLGLVAGTVGLLILYALGVTSGDEVLARRFDLDHLVASAGGRLERIVAALRIWAEHPFLGVGWGAFKQHSGRYIASGGLGAHNGYTNVLAECGLLGFVPLMVLTVAVVRRSLCRIDHVSSDHEFWRPYFLCGLIAQLVTNVFNDYLWERYLWVSFGFVAVLEHLHHSAQAREARARLSQMRRVGVRGLFRPAARTSGGA